MKHLFNKIKYFIQRIFRGYSDEDIYDLEYFIVKKIRKPLKAFVKHQEEKGYTLPRDFSKDPAAWLIILKKMEFAFDQRWKEETDLNSYVMESNSMTTDERVQFNKKIKEGFELFGKYFCDLWD